MNEVSVLPTAFGTVGEYFTVHVRHDDPLHVVSMSGELDVASSGAALRACTSIDHLHVIADLADLEFMDCAGYGALVTARNVLDRRGGSLRVVHPRGGPLRLLSLIDRLGGESNPASSLWSRSADV